MNANPRDAADEPKRLDFHGELNLLDLSEEFKRERRLRIADFLAVPSALRLYDSLLTEVGWRTVVVADGKILAGAPQPPGAPPLVRPDTCEFASQACNRDYAAFFDTNRVFSEDFSSSEVASIDAETVPLGELRGFMNSPVFLSMIQTIMGVREVCRVDLQATRHSIGQFSGFSLGPSRGTRPESICALFQLTLTPEWPVEWGGTLEFSSSRGHITEGYVPSFNVFDLFCVPQGHWTMAVSPSASAPRFAISGRIYAKKSIVEQSR